MFLSEYNKKLHSQISAESKKPHCNCRIKNMKGNCLISNIVFQAKTEVVNKDMVEEKLYIGSTEKNMEKNITIIK